MTRRPALQASRMTAIAATLATALTWVAACGVADDNPTSPSGSTGAGASGTGTGVGGNAESCESGELRECKVDIDDDNCFVGVQECGDEGWGPCVEGNDTLAIGGSGGCPANPCNTGCAQYDEDPPDITATGTPPPTLSSGSIYSLPGNIANACLDDSVHSCGGNCTTPGYCQFDTHCVGNDTCPPWAANESEPPGPGQPNLTVGIACDPARVPVCNRGDQTGGMGAEISIWTVDEDICGGSGPGVCQPAVSTNIAATGATQVGTCGPLPNDLAPGECVEVDCSGVAYSSAMYHVNGCDEFGCPVTETDAEDNWGYYDDTIPCACSSTNASSSLQDVTMFMVLDNSGSMVSQGIWGPAQNATKSFITDPGSDTINFAMRMYGDNPTSGCDSSSCSVAACTDMAHGPDFLSNAAHENALTTYIDNISTGGNGTPHLASVGGLVAASSNWAQANPTDLTVAVYISDGGNDNCGANNTTVAAPAGTANANDGVLTFTVALPGASLSLLNEIASQGGTGAAIDLTGSSNVDADLTQALQNIQGALLSCTLPIPNASTVDPSQVQVVYLPTAGGQVPLTEVANAGACSGANEFYFVPDAVNPTDITMCPTICNTVRNDTGSTVEFVGGCSSQFTGSSVIETYTNGCAAGEAQTWDFLSFDTTIPAGTTVTWEVSASNVDEATAAMGPWTLVCTSTQGTPDVLPSSPIDL
ncbi:MAG: vWA domain-containing protein, partial [Polyangiaceae bacterium]